MPKEKNYRVVNPIGNTWTARFTTEDAAWGRILSARGVKDTREARKSAMKDGWKVRKVDDKAGL